MQTKFDDLIVNVNNLQKCAVRANKKVDIHNHRMAVGAKLTKKPNATAVREKLLQCGYESHQVTKML